MIPDLLSCSPGSSPSGLLLLTHLVPAPPRHTCCPLPQDHCSLRSLPSWLFSAFQVLAQVSPPGRGLPCHCLKEPPGHYSLILFNFLDSIDHYLELYLFAYLFDVCLALKTRSSLQLGILLSCSPQCPYHTAQGTCLLNGQLPTAFSGLSVFLFVSVSLCSLPSFTFSPHSA